MNQISRIACVAAALAAAVSACQSTSGSSGGPPPVDIVYSQPSTIEGANHFADVELVGPKQVGLQFTLRQNTTIKSIVLSRWAAGNNAGEQSETFTLNQVFAATPAQAVGHTFYFEIPNSASFEQCEGLYYTFGAVYQVEGESQNALYLGGARLILPTKKRVGNTIQQALCGDPPPPGA